MVSALENPEIFSLGFSVDFKHCFVHPPLGLLNFFYYCHPVTELLKKKAPLNPSRFQTSTTVYCLNLNCSKLIHDYPCSPSDQNSTGGLVCTRCWLESFRLSCCCNTAGKNVASSRGTPLLNALCAAAESVHWLTSKYSTDWERWLLLEYTHIQLWCRCKNLRTLEHIILFLANPQVHSSTKCFTIFDGWVRTHNHTPMSLFTFLTILSDVCKVWYSQTWFKCSCICTAWYHKLHISLRGLYNMQTIWPSLLSPPKQEKM